MMGHLLLGSLHSEPILSELATSGPERLARALRALASSLLDARPAAFRELIRSSAAGYGERPGDAGRRGRCRRGCW